MISKRSVSLIAILIFIGYILTVLFGKYVAIPFWDLLYSEEPPNLSLKVHKFFLIAPLISLIVPIIYSLVLYKYAKQYQSNPLVWATLGLIKGPLAIVLFALTILYQNQESEFANLRSVFKQIMIWFLVILLVGMIIKLLTNITPALFARFLVPKEFGYYSMFSRVGSILNLVYISAINIAVAIWIFEESKRRKESSVLWVFLALISGLFAPILFIIYNLLKNKLDSRTSTNT